MDPTTTPTETIESDMETIEPFYAYGVRSCDYVVHPDGTIVYCRDNEAVREFHSGHTLHSKLMREILEVYPNMPFSPVS